MTSPTPSTTGNIEQSNKNTSKVAAVSHCVNMENDAEEGHYWMWEMSPKSIPKSFKRCRLCGRIDASEAIAQAVIESHNKAIDEVKVAGYGYDDGTGFVLKISFAELEKLKKELK
jgi:hypothetical protein